jgi:hypothetical protein
MSIYTIGLTILLYFITGFYCAKDKDVGHAIMWFSYGFANLGLLWYEISKLKDI